jgi:hypothetical protein
MIIDLGDTPIEHEEILIPDRPSVPSGVSNTWTLRGCSRCHAGYGLDGAGFDFADAGNVDCLVCHDTTDTYSKGLAGMP